MIRFFVKHPTASNILMFIFLAVGALTLPQIQRETIPDVAKPTVQVQIVYPGANPQEVFTEIVDPINDAITDQVILAGGRAAKLHERVDLDRDAPV